MTENLKREGLAYLMNSRSEHYFVGGLDYGRTMNQPLCKACEKALAKREAKKAVKP